MKQFARSFVVAFLVLVPTVVAAQSNQLRPPGLQPYVPTCIEWLALVVNIDQKHDFTAEEPFGLSVLPADHETVLILVRYSPRVDRAYMNKYIETTRKVIMGNAKANGWENWVKIKERVEAVTQR